MLDGEKAFFYFTMDDILSASTVASLRRDFHLADTPVTVAASNQRKNRGTSEPKEVSDDDEDVRCRQATTRKRAAEIEASVRFGIVLHQA